tara:strand:- start:570 stop:818 length:249 start_codon:yes stop_codon:yes gene_type:complete
MKKLRQKRIPKKVSEQLETSKTRKKITELSYNSEILPFKVRFVVDEIRKELGFNRTITLEDIKLIDKHHRWFKRNKKKLLAE